MLPLRKKQVCVTLTVTKTILDKNLHYSDAIFKEVSLLL